MLQNDPSQLHCCVKQHILHFCEGSGEHDQ